MNVREFTESPMPQGVDERIAYTLDVSPWGVTPTSPVVALKNAAGTDVISSFSTGAASVSGNVITTPTIHSLVAGQIYRLEIKFVISGNTLEAWGNIRAEE